MAPDLNSVPPSPRPANSLPPASTAISSSRRSSHHSPQVTLPIASTIPPSSSLHHTAPIPPMSVAYARGDNTGVGTGPGPLRHPRPLTAAEVHLQLEKEQEAVVSTSVTYYESNSDSRFPGEPSHARAVPPPCSTICLSCIHLLQHLHRSCRRYYIYH